VFVTVVVSVTVLLLQCCYYFDRLMVMFFCVKKDAGCHTSTAVCRWGVHFLYQAIEPIGGYATESVTRGQCFDAVGWA